MTICRAAFGRRGGAGRIRTAAGAAQIFVGFAVFIDGARPDVPAVYPSAPVNTRAGWGFMVLTNMLPESGERDLSASTCARRTATGIRRCWGHGR